jgi:ADP-L-glycero-D-manno-heptose 6-epimerase
MEKKIIVTGGAGFIGSCLIQHLNSLGFKNLVIVDNIASTEKWKNLNNKTFIDLLHKDSLFEWLESKEKEIEAIIHLGACSSTLETDANYLLENNYRYSVKLAEFAIPRKIRFISASSAATYGDGNLGFSDNEIEKYAPLNMYGFSKHLFDLWLLHHHYLENVVGLKFFNVFGPNEFHKGRMQSAVLKMVPEVLNTGVIRLFKSNDPRFGDGEQVRDFIYVKDVVKMTAAFLKNQVTGIFNVGTGRPSTWNQLGYAVIKALDRKVPIEYTEMPRDLIGKYQNYTCADMTKWKQNHLPEPTFSLEEAVIDYVRNYILPHKCW